MFEQLCDPHLKIVASLSASGQGLGSDSGYPIINRSRRFADCDQLPQIVIYVNLLATIGGVSAVGRLQPIATEATGWLLDRYRAEIARASTTFPEDDADFRESQK